MMTNPQKTTATSHPHVGYNYIRRLLELSTLTFFGGRSSTGADKNIDVLLAFMPFGNAGMPSLGLSLLKAGLAKHGISCRIEYYGLDFAQAIGFDFYLMLSGFRQTFLGEWVFSSLAFANGQPGDTESHDETLGKLLEMQEVAEKRVEKYQVSQQDFRARLIQVREKAEEFIDHCVDHIAALSPKILGFSTMFSQNCASLAVARRVKERLGAEAPKIIIGGSNCEGLMGYTMLKSFPWIDYVCCGEGDLVFIDFVAELLHGKNPHVRGMIGRNADGLDEFSSPEPVTSMDALPMPNFDDYFTSLRENGLDTVMSPQMAVETSRGCWWGERSHCTFCGLNGLTMKYRSKSPDRVLLEIDHLVEKHGPLSFQVVDNILNLDFFRSLFPELLRKHVRLDLLFETKSNLNRDQLGILRESGVRHIQPGIESFSDDALRLMRKGVTGLQNIWLLKACREIGIDVTWNWLWGFPQEKASDFERMRHWIPLLHHLEPPGNFGTIHLDRFSPLFNFPEMFGLRNVRAALPYRLIYPLDEAMLYNLAYYFDFEYADGRSPQDYTAGLAEELRGWKREWNIPTVAAVQPTLHRPAVGKLARPILSALGAPVPAMLGAPILAMLDIHFAILIFDTRRCASRTLLFKKGLEAKVLRYLADIRPYETVIRNFVDQGYPESDVEKAVDGLVERKIAIIDSGKCLSLVTTGSVSMFLATVFGKGVRTLQMARTLVGSRPRTVTPASDSPHHILPNRNRGLVPRSITEQ